MSMAYTVKQISTLSGVTVRTLHFYEEEGLLRPAYYGSNGYRYYEEKELFQLQQILFFKELGFTIKQIKKVVGKDDFNQLSALHSHKKSLIQEWKKIGKLLKTLDKTIEHLEGKKKMQNQEIFDGFKIGIVKLSKIDSPLHTLETTVFNSVKDPVKNEEDLQDKGGLAYYQNIIDTVHPIFKELASCIEEALEPVSPKVQSIIARHHTCTNQHHEASYAVYKAMAELYAKHPDFRKQLDPFHPKLAEFMSEGMMIFADKKLQ